MVQVDAHGREELVAWVRILVLGWICFIYKWAMFIFILMIFSWIEIVRRRSVNYSIYHGEIQGKNVPYLVIYNQLALLLHHKLQECMLVMFYFNNSIKNLMFFLFFHKNYIPLSYFSTPDLNNFMIIFIFKIIFKPLCVKIYNYSLSILQQTTLSTI